jgi:hypothetical protein
MVDHLLVALDVLLEEGEPPVELLPGLALFVLRPKPWSWLTMVTATRKRKDGETVWSCGTCTTFGSAFPDEERSWTNFPDEGYDLESTTINAPTVHLNVTRTQIGAPSYRFAEMTMGV